MKQLVLASMFVSHVACTAADTAADPTKTADVATKPALAGGPADGAAARVEPVPATPTKVEPGPAAPVAVAPAPAEPVPAEPVPAEPVPAAPVAAEPVAAEPTPGEPAQLDPAAVAVTPALEVPVKPVTAQALTAAWRPVVAPGEALSLVDLNAGVLARAGEKKWFQRGDGDTLVPVVMDREPQHEVLGTWPSDAWVVETREVPHDTEEGEDTYQQLRMMKLRNGARWVPQPFGPNSEQWWHPGTEHWHETHISALSGMLVYTDEFTGITRVAGKYPDPEIGPHRGDVIGFLETGTAEIYVLSRSPEGYLVQVDCADEACVSAHTMKLPMPSWDFGRSAVRGRHAVSTLATGCLQRNSNGTACDPAGAREFVLHNHGKPGSWVLEELPAGQRATGMWASTGGGLWLLVGEGLRWRDAKGGWHDVALPEGLGAPSVALTEDRNQVWIAGKVGGATKVFAASATAPATAPAAAPTPAP